MTNGGWTMVMASASLGPAAQAELLTVDTASGSYLPVAIVQALAAISSQVHIRGEGLADTQSVTSVAEGIAIQNLRLGRLLNHDALAFNDDPPTEWTGPFADGRLFDFCAIPPLGEQERVWPNVYHAACNSGLHLLDWESNWTYEVNVPLEVYVR